MRLIFAIILTIGAALTLGVYAGQMAPEVLPAHIVQITTPIATPIATMTPCDIGTVQRTVDTRLNALTLDVGTEEVSFQEARNGRTVKLSEPVQEIGLRILNPAACTTDIIVVTQKGDSFSAPSGWQIEPVQRRNGIRWNKWSTDWRVIAPADRIVIEMRYPIVEEKGLSRKIRYERYFPYTPELHTVATILQGVDHNKDLVDTAFAELRASRVRSSAFPHLLVADVPQLKHEYFERLPAIEWIDWGEFLDDPQHTTEYFWIKAGMNRDVFGRNTANFAGARGYLQFTDLRGNGTYTMVRKIFPTAKLIPDFATGTKDQKNSMKAAILLHDINLAEMIKKYGKKIADDPRLEEFLAAYYNASPGSVDKSLKPALQYKRKEWAGELLGETKEYIAKLRYIRDEYPLGALVAATAPIE